jgi:hypothetical protein
MRDLVHALRMTVYVYFTTDLDPGGNRPTMPTSSSTLCPTWDDAKLPHLLVCGWTALSRRSPVEERQGNGWFYRRTRGGRTRPTEATSRPSRLVTRQRPAPVGQSPNAASRAASSASAALRGRSTSVVALSPSRNCRRKFGAELLMIWWMDTKCCDLVNEPPSSIIILLRVVERRETYAQQRRQ